MAVFYALGLNFCLCLELILTMRDPFYPAGRRMKWYLLFSILFAVIVPFMTIGRGLSINYSEDTEGDSKFVSTVFESAFTVCLISLFFIFAIYSSV